MASHATTVYAKEDVVFARKFDSSFWDLIEDWEAEKQNPSSDYNRGKFAEVQTAGLSPDNVYYRLPNACNIGSAYRIEVDGKGEITNISPSSNRTLVINL